MKPPWSFIFFAAITFVFTGLAACTLGGQVTSTLSQVGDPAEHTTIVSHPMYKKFDAYSFSLAHVAYPATSAGSHAIPVGNYLLRHTMDAFTGKPVELVRLTSFKSNCRHIWGTPDQAACDTQFTIVYTKRGSEKQLQINQSWSGPFLSKEILDPRGDKPIVDQAQQIMDQIIEKIKQEAK